MTGDILDDPFHFCALRAYMEIYAQTRRFPSDSEATRRLAYQYYEQGLAEKDRCKQPVDSGRPLRANLARAGMRSAGGAAIVEREDGELKSTPCDTQSCREDDVSQPTPAPASEPV